MSLPRRPAGLRADQEEAWEWEAADYYGGPTEPRPTPTDEPPWPAPDRPEDSPENS